MTGSDEARPARVVQEPEQTVGPVGTGVFGEDAFPGRLADPAARVRREVDRGERVVVTVGDQDLGAGVKKASSPSQRSVRMVAPQAAASKRRPDGHQPEAAIAARVTFSVMDDEA